MNVEGRRYTSIPSREADGEIEGRMSSRGVARFTLLATGPFFELIFWAMCNSNVWLLVFMRPISLRKR